jgi:hypothetical protein
LFDRFETTVAKEHAHTVLAIKQSLSWFLPILEEKQNQIDELIVFGSVAK